MEYLRAHPGFLEHVVTGPHVSRETFLHWTKLRQAKTRQDSRRSLMSGFMTPAARTNTRIMLADLAGNRNKNHHRLLYELAQTCAQVGQCDQFELLVPAITADDDTISILSSTSTATMISPHQNGHGQQNFGIESQQNQSANSPRDGLSLLLIIFERQTLKK